MSGKKRQINKPFRCTGCGKDYINIITVAEGAGAEKTSNITCPGCGKPATIGWKPGERIVTIKTVPKP